MQSLDTYGYRVWCVYLSVVEEPHRGGRGPPELSSHEGKKNYLQGSCRLCDVCTVFVLPVGWVFGLCHFCF